VPDGFTVDLDRLHDVAASDLPTIITCVNDAQTSLNSASTDQNRAFSGQYGEISSDAYWLTEDLLTGLQSLASNLNEAKSAITEIANRYRAADGQPPYPSS
jgi:hypothetical protein